ncbi:MAG: PD-(D/E)XK nuclease family protein [Bacilli bacterium]|nr:PD-(D/E)XK nuclease family protein [Bacilli bacterium]
MNLTNYDLVITSNSNKKRILRKLNEEKKLVNVKFMSLDELLSSLSFSFDQKSIYHVMKQYDIKYDNAKVYLDNIRYVSDKLNNDKMNKLREIKELVKDDLIIDDDFKKYIKDKKVCIYGYDYITNYQKSVIEGINYKVVNNPVDSNSHNIYGFNKIDDEIVFVLSSINRLIRDGIDINKIKLINVTDDYLFRLKFISNLFNIRINFNESKTIYETLEFNNLLNSYTQDIELKSNNKDILNRFVSIVNKYSFIDDKDEQISMIINEAKNSKINSDEYENSVDIINISELEDDEYGFYLGFTEESAYIKYKDEDFFSDKEKKILGFETSDELNKIMKENLIKSIKSAKNLTITYSLASTFNIYYPSSLIDELGYVVIKDEKYDYACSNLYNSLLLYKDIDKYIKYGDITSELELLFSNYEYSDPFDNSFKGINSNKLIKYIDNLSLSYSSLNKYYECKFKYYLENILKITEDEETNAIVIGNLFHEVLSKMSNPSFDFDKEYEESTKELEMTNKDKFFINKLKEELRFVINTINKQYKYMSFDKSIEEERVAINFDKTIKITFKGFIDKALYKEEDGKIYMIIIDYKTGDTKLDLNNNYYGLNLQLPVYLYLSDHINNLDNVEVLGFYIQRILNGVITQDKNKKLDDIRKENLKLQGYTISNTEKTKLVDSSYEKSEIIKSLGLTQSGSFYSYSKVLSEVEMNNLKTLVESKINEMIEGILSASFEIDPKKLDDEDMSCKYCKYKDICFKKEKDYKKLDKKDYKEFLN